MLLIYKCKLKNVIIEKLIDHNTTLNDQKCYAHLSVMS